MLRIRMKGRETVFERRIAKRDVKEAIAGHLQQFGRESVPSGEKDDQGRAILVQREIPPTEFQFFWVENPGTDREKEEPIPLG